jgi:polysaccharide pyruvyl transferase WcaK-like protein
VRWLLYGDLGERHVVESLERALREAGHDVAHIPSLEPVTGPLDTHLRRADERRRLIDAALPADALFVFRVDELVPELVRHAHDRGARTIGWFCDDPLYYGTTYRHVAEAYDVTLHTAREDVLAFYEQRHGARGYAFPYWTDDAAYPYVYDLDAADVDVGFVGSFGGARRRRWRYDLLASLPFRVRFYGPLTRGLSDDAAIGAGTVPVEDVPRVLGRFRLGLNVAQTFDEVAPGEPVYFEELVRFGEYYFPSRLIAYAAAGVPAVTLHHAGSPAPLAAGIAVTSRDELVERARELLADREALLAASAAARKEFETCLTAQSRVRMLEHIVGDGRAHDLATRAEMWRRFGDKPAPEAPGVPRAIELDSIEALTADIVDPRPAERRLRVLLIGWGGEPLRGLARAARLLGHDLAAVDLGESPEFASSGSELERGDGPVELDDEWLGRLLDNVRPEVVLFADGAAPSEAWARALRASRTSVVSIRLLDPTFVSETISYLDRFDAVITISGEAENAYRSKGFRTLRLTPAGEPPADPVFDGTGIAVRSGGTAEGVALRSRLTNAAPVVEPAAAAIQAFLPDVPGLIAEASAAMSRGVAAIVPGGTSTPGVAPVLDYRNGAELAALTAYYARRTAEADALRRKAFRTMLGHRWSQQLGPIFEAVAPVDGPPIDRPRVVVLGYYGSRNLGDDLILDVIASRLDARIDVLAYGPHVAADFGLPAASALDHETAEDLVAGADLLVVGGGGLLHDRELAGGASLADVFGETTRAGITGVIARTTALAVAHAKPVALFAVGAGPISTDRGRTLLRFLVERTASLSVRDEVSAGVIRTITDAAEVAADPTLLLDLADPQPARAWLAGRGIGDYLVASVRRWAGAPPDLPARIAALLDSAIEHAGLRVVFVPLQASEAGRRDRAAASEVLRDMRRRDAAVEVEDYDRELLRGVLAGARAGVAMRLHASILANASGVPTIGLAYDPKVRAYYEELGRARYALDLTFDPGAASQLLADLIAHRDDHARDIAQALAPMRERAERGFRSLERLLEAGRRGGRRPTRERNETLARSKEELLS